MKCPTCPNELKIVEIGGGEIILQCKDCGYFNNMLENLNKRKR